MRSCNLSAGHGSVLVAEHLWWCLVTGTKSVPSPCGTTQHITLTQNACLWDEHSAACCTYIHLNCFWVVCQRPMLFIQWNACLKQNRFLLQKRSAHSGSVLAGWTESSTWTACGTMPYPGRTAGEMLCCFDTCWWFVAVLRASGQSYVTSAKAWELGLQPLAF